MKVRVKVYDVRERIIRQQEGAAPVALDLTGLRQPTSVLIDVVPGELDGPYDRVGNGVDVHGHALNSYGRCAGMNELPEPTCTTGVGSATDG